MFRPITFRHRGTFTAVYEVFAVICKTLSKQDDLKCIPERWLNEFLDQISSKEVSTTRRSGGLPFGFLSILTALPLKSRNRWLTTIVNQLLSIAKSPVEKRHLDRLDLPQVHAFNVLKILFETHSLSAEMREYLSEMIEATVSAFSSPAFPIRNCACMIFKPLFHRMFGQLENQGMGVLEFSTLYPRIWKLVKSELHTIVSGISGQLHPALHPLLTIFSTLQGGGDVESVNEDLFVCACSQIYKTRSLASDAFVANITADCKIKVIEKILKTMSLSNQNALHGTLMIILKLAPKLLALEATGTYELAERILQLAQLNNCDETLALMFRALSFLVANGAELKESLGPRIYSLALRRFDNASFVVQEEIALILLELSGSKFASLLITDLVLKCLGMCYETQNVTMEFLYTSDVEVGDERVCSRLIELLDSEYPNVRIRSAKLLGKLATNRYLDSLFEYSFNHAKTERNTRLVKELVILAAKMIAAGLENRFDSFIELCDLFSNEMMELRIRESVAMAMYFTSLDLTNMKVIKVLLRLLIDDDCEIRERAALLFSKAYSLNTALMPERCTSILLDSLGRKENDVRFWLETNGFLGSSFESSKAKLFDREEVNKYRERGLVLFRLLDFKYN